MTETDAFISFLIICHLLVYSTVASPVVNIFKQVKSLAFLQIDVSFLVLLLTGN